MTASGFCLYSWQSEGPELAREIATTLAGAFGIVATHIAYAIVTPPDSKGETLRLARMPWDEFFSSGNPAATGEFSAEGALSKRRGKCFLAVSDGRFDNLSRISLAFDVHIDAVLAELERLIPRLVALSKPAYGIAFPARTIFSASSYSRGMGSSLFAKEDPGLFQRDYRIGTPEKTFQGERLRMVYPLNLLNEQHLSIRVDKGTLHDFITDDARNGRLSGLPGARWIWTVDSARLQALNDELGARGIPISMAAKSPSPKRRLP